MLRCAFAPVAAAAAAVTAPLQPVAGLLLALLRRAMQLEQGAKQKQRQQVCLVCMRVYFQLYDDAMSLGVALPMSAHVLLLEVLLTYAAAADGAAAAAGETADNKFSAAECLRMAQRVSVRSAYQ